MKTVYECKIQKDLLTDRYRPLVGPVKRSGAEIATGPLAGAEWLHVAPPYSPHDLLEIIGELDATEWRPKIVFEPAPNSCHPGQREDFERVMARVDISSWVLECTVVLTIDPIMKNSRHCIASS